MFIYLHIPFCNFICNYCDFPKVLYDKKYSWLYLESLEKEIKNRYRGEKISSIFIGGGTPTSLDIEEFTKLLEITNLFKKDKEFEFTIESNIDSLTEDKIKLMTKYGVNRVSLGVQSFHDRTLKLLNRHHNSLQVKEVVTNLKGYGIDNISIDYIYGVNSDLMEVKEDIDSFLELAIPHISCYSLIIEDNTVFGINDREYIDDELEYEMYNYIEKKLKLNGYIHYEVSNYAKEGYQSLHNLNYWNNGFYYGFGLGAVSYLDYYRISNTLSLSKYLEGKYINSKDFEDVSIRMSNELILGLRKKRGISISEFKNKYNLDVLEYSQVNKLVDEGKLVIQDDYLFIPDCYFYLSNDILVNFV